ncbi:glycoside hydrolase family 97 catalytic domain-containing protein [Sphingobacterium sp. N143]|uniref:glycoside hydrolase family 97 protein n=1 Tax=Sphingobacterium sp. N143 TaxID=2746727 RepID=UPI00257882EA|nr:glycoside hydrolase family 97 protein [Sphingobacterium sp. N143]MDM1292691.1 glycoside hydrolase family 97 catalytic domain-containing protein [Sphingobacterium sp. N143]
MKKIIVVCGLLLVLFSRLAAQELKINGPDGKLEVHLSLDQGKLYYRVDLEGKVMLEKSPLGLQGEHVDLANNLRVLDSATQVIDVHYQEPKIKRRNVHYQANELRCTMENDVKQQLVVIFRVSNNDIAFRYFIPQVGEAANLKVTAEMSGFKFPESTTTFLTAQANPMIGWKKTKPSYEEPYGLDEAMGTASKYGVGYTFPALFHVGTRGWVLLSETGLDASYCGAKLNEGTKAGLYKIAFPEAGENNGIGKANPTLALPGYTPWRTLTVGNTLKPIVETTVPFDVVEARFAASKPYSFGRATWSWLEWQDGSINFEDQKKFVDLSASMGYEFVLVDNWWDAQIGHKKIEELANYGRQKGVGLCLWYNSNGYWNDAPQTPKNKMNSSAARKKEMAWMRSIGIKGIKVDFFGGDKQETLKLYEDILSDANEYGLAVIFHGCTLPRGWERMYPNFVGSEAVLASENLIFTQQANDTEALNATLHPFIRNTVAAMDFGPVLLNKRHNRENNGGTIRRTTETFQLATAVLFQTPVQNFGITPNNLQEMPMHVIDFMKQVPTTWDETVFIDGYPGRYVVLARRHQERWYIAAINAEQKAKDIELQLPMLSGGPLQLINDTDDRKSRQETVRPKKDKTIRLTVQPNGGALLYGE